jgi:hypothetical protein
MRSFLFLLFSATVGIAFAQNAPKLEKIAIGNSGCAAYFPKGMPAADLSYSQDSSAVYTTEMEVGEHVFGNITVKFKAPFSSATDANLEEVMINYLEFLQSLFGVTATAGVGRGHKMESNPKAIGVIDYWEDEDGLQYAIKAWADPGYIGIMYIYGDEDYPVFNLQQMYLDGFRFPGK